MRILIFDPIITGHHLEYIHHLYEAEENKGYDVIICVPETIKNVKDNFEWQQKSNIQFMYLDDKYCESLKHLGRLRYARSFSKKLKLVSKSVKPDKILLISIIQALPLLPLFFLGRKEKISGIIYKIYLYSWRKYSFAQKIYESIRFMSVKCSCNIKNVFVLNDDASARRLRMIWHKNKFVSLPDPFQSKKETQIFNTLLLDKNKIKILHFGAMTSRKGTMDIMNAIEILCNEDKVSNFQFAFAGKINKDIKQEFYYKYNVLKNKCDILVMDRFCSYDELDELCRECDIILAPYKNVYSSSGVIGYAAKFHKPVVVPDDGLLGKLVKKYKLGMAIKNLDAIKISQILASNEVIPINNEMHDNYISKNSVKNFNKVIYENI